MRPDTPPAIQSNRHHEGPIIGAIEAWLGGEYEEVDYEKEELFGDTYDELWILPLSVEILYRINECYRSQHFAWGWFGFLEYEGVRYVAEQNASPFIIYRKKKDA